MHTPAAGRASHAPHIRSSQVVSSPDVAHVRCLTHSCSRASHIRKTAIPTPPYCTHLTHPLANSNQKHFHWFRALRSHATSANIQHEVPTHSARRTQMISTHLSYVGARQVAGTHCVYSTTVHAAVRAQPAITYNHASPVGSMRRMSRTHQFGRLPPWNLLAMSPS